MPPLKEAMNVSNKAAVSENSSVRRGPDPSMTPSTKTQLKRPLPTAELGNEMSGIVPPPKLERVENWRFDSHASLEVVVGACVHRRFRRARGRLSIK